MVLTGERYCWMTGVSAAQHSTNGWNSSQRPNWFSCATCAGITSTITSTVNGCTTMRTLCTRT